MALTRRIKKLSKAAVARISGRHVLTCTECNDEEVEVPADVARVTCGRCVQRLVAPPAGHKPDQPKKPRGWHFKMYYEQNGIVYSKGKEVTDPELIAELRQNGDEEIKPAKKTVSKKTSKTKAVKKTKGKRNARITK